MRLSTVKPIPQQRTGHRPYAYLWFAAAGLIVLVIAGLLGMHTLSVNSAETGRSTGAQPSAVIYTGEVGNYGVDVLTPAAGIGDPSLVGGTAHTDSSPCGVECDPVGHSDEHGMLAMACVLALMIGLLILRRPLFRRLTNLHRAIFLPFSYLFVARYVRPPSLISLSISRT